MSAAPVERPSHEDRPLTLLEEANKITEQLPGYRVEIIGGLIIVAPPPDAAHAEGLTEVMIPFLAAGLHGPESRLLQGVGVWLPDGPEDYAVPDLALVDGDIKDHLVEYNCYDPVSFRMVLEVTSNNYANDLRVKVAAYATARIPVYVVVDRKHHRLHVLTEPAAGEYQSHQVLAPGQLATLPDSIGAKVTLDVTAVLDAARGSSKEK